MGGYSRASKGISQEYLSVTPDSVRVYILTSSYTVSAAEAFAIALQDHQRAFLVGEVRQ